MSKRLFPLSRVYRLLEPGPVVLVTTACETKYNFFILEVSKAWIDPSRKAEEILDAAFARGFALAHP